MCFFLKRFVLGQLSKLKSSRDDPFGHTWLTARHVYDNDEQTYQNSQKSMHAITVAKMTLDLTYKCIPYEENDVKPRMEETSNPENERYF